ncbi:MAG: SDR family oxidoreductase [Chloroflexi bacterium]|nr:MAG: SDR family oxidoreductase [Chloroflexota bacterium]
MRVFVTGATGFIGSAVVRELLDAGHEVLGLARSDQAAAAMAAAGAKVHRGDIGDLDSLRRGAAASDGVVHTAFNHDFSVSRHKAAAADRLAVEAMAEALVGTDRPIVITSGTAGLSPGHLATEQTIPGFDAVGRHAVEDAVFSFAGRGVRPAVVRLPPTVHGRGDHGFISMLIDIARNKGISGYPGEGSNRWPAVNRLDAAHLFRLALESAPAGARLHGVGEEGIPVREIAEVIGRHLGLPVVAIPPEEAAGHFGFLAAFFALDCPASSALTQQLLGWHPAQPGLVADLEQGHYFERRPVAASR